MQVIAEVWAVHCPSAYLLYTSKEECIDLPRLEAEWMPTVIMVQLPADPDKVFNLRFSCLVLNTIAP